MRIGVLARRTGVSVDALRLYEARGLIRSERRANGYRDFAEGSDQIVRLIRLGQSLGFTLSEVGEVLQGLQSGMPTEEVAGLLQARIAVVDARIAALMDLRGILEARLSEACPLVMARDAGSGRAKVA
jgi:MerR family transcriptional regulator, copper efflux regulator